MPGKAPSSQPHRQDSVGQFVQGWDIVRSDVREDPAPYPPLDAAAFALEPEPADYQTQNCFTPSPSLGLNISFSFDDHLADAADSLSPQCPAGRHFSQTTLPRTFPAPGDMIARFLILSELGRGSFARVYLAQQRDLGNRPVALKVTAVASDEPENLARLQHAHIVPIHSVHDDPDTGFRLICMPHFGGANLADVLASTDASLPSVATGKSLIDALDRVGTEAVPSASIAISFAPPSDKETPENHQKSPHSPTADKQDPPARQSRSALGSLLARLHRHAAVGPSGNSLPSSTKGESKEPARRYLCSATFIEAAVWIAAKLADGLEHAHARGILHRDIKPSNMLIAADGTPMLLDFNLSARIDPDATEQASIGGTLPYMAPEHLQAFNPESGKRPEEVGPQADVYSLGLVLFEMIAGKHPFSPPPSDGPLSATLASMTEERQQGPPSLRQFNPDTPWSLDSIVAKCLEPDPARRYQRAGDLAEDLRCFLDHQPLKHAPETSIREQLTKWCRRHPSITSGSSVALLASVLIVTSASLAFVTRNAVLNQQALAHFESFQNLAHETLFRLNDVIGPVEHLRPGISLADQTLALYEVDPRGAWLKKSRVTRLTPENQVRLKETVSELLQARSRADVRLAGFTTATQRTHALEQAIARLNAAEQLEGRPSRTLLDDRAGYYAALGRLDQAAQDRAGRDHLAPSTSSARELTLEALSHLRSGQLDLAETSLNQAIALDTESFWAWFDLGSCHYLQGRHADAAADFTVASILEPNFAWPHLNRGILLQTEGRLLEAKYAYDRALSLNPSFLDARRNRALLCLGLGDTQTALADLEIVLDNQPGDLPTLLARAECLDKLGLRDQAESEFTQAIARNPKDPLPLIARGTFRVAFDPPGAASDLQAALRLDPDHPRAHLALGDLLRHDQPDAALEHLRKAFEGQPNLYEAVELHALILARRGDPAAERDVDKLLEAPTSHRLYNAACALALLYAHTHQPHHADRALSLLERSLNAGVPSDQAALDPDLQSLRPHPEFSLLVPCSP